MFFPYKIYLDTLLKAFISFNGPIKVFLFFGSPKTNFSVADFNLMSRSSYTFS